MVSLSNLMPPIHHFDDKWSIVMANESTVTSQFNMVMAQLLIWISQHKTGMAKGSIVSSKLSPLISQWIILMSALSLRSLRSSSLYQNGACESGFVAIQHFSWFLSWNFFFPVQLCWILSPSYGVSLDTCDLSELAPSCSKIFWPL